MKKSTRTLLMLAGAALATSVAQANIIGTTYDTTMLGMSVGNSGDTFSISSEVTGPSSGEYTYTYTLITDPTTAEDGSGIKEFDVLAGGIWTPTVTAITGAGSFGNNYIDGSGEVSYSSGGASVNVAGYVLSFESTLPPTFGSATAEDGGNWSSESGVVVPNTPDGGMTMSLMGGALLGLGALRRKLAR